MKLSGETNSTASAPTDPATPVSIALSAKVRVFSCGDVDAHRFRGERVVAHRHDRAADAAAHQPRHRGEAKRREQRAPTR